jgi:hypothetical protein
MRVARAARFHFAPFVEDAMAPTSSCAATINARMARKIALAEP